MKELSVYNKIIRRSHNRCVEYGVDKNIPSPIRIIKNEEFHMLLDKNRELIKVARPFMEILYDFLSGSGFSLYLTDEEGVVLTIIGDEDIIIDQTNMGIVEGADMSEKSAGTNGIGTTIHEDCSLQVSGEEHFIKIFHVWTCSSAIIHSEEGSKLGCLNLTGRRQLAHPHTLGLVVAAVKSIENHLRVEKTKSELFQTNQYLNKIMGSINMGIFAVDINGIVKSINSSACNMVCIEEKNIINRNISILWDKWDYIFHKISAGQKYENEEVTSKLRNKRFNLSVYPIKDKYGNITELVGIFKDIQNIYDLVNKYTGMGANYTFEDIVGVSEKILDLKMQAKSIANSPSTVLIEGESGTGKELIAQSIHNNSDRRSNSFVAINCGAIPKNLIESELFGYEEGAFTGAKRGGRPGKFELANGGTLFLDEIGEMPLDMQVNLLRVLQEGYITRVGGNKYIKVDVRIIAATNKNLKKEIEKGTFREDLYYRLSVIPIYVPPLRERIGDIEILIKHFLKVKAVKLSKSVPKIREEIYEKMIMYSWPGNVRELENCIENIVNMNGNTSFTFENTNLEKGNSDSIPKELEDELCSLEEMERKAIIRCIEKCKGNITKSCKILGINRSTMYKKIKKYSI
jgi:PAS domain S-box-containing protein